MAQAFEYQVTTDSNAANFATTLAGLDAQGWEVIGYAVKSVTTSTQDQWALLRRRV